MAQNVVVMWRRKLREFYLSKVFQVSEGVANEVV
jgi:hypothetical protein